MWSLGTVNVWKAALRMREHRGNIFLRLRCVREHVCACACVWWARSLPVGSLWAFVPTAKDLVSRVLWGQGATLPQAWAFLSHLWLRVADGTRCLPSLFKSAVAAPGKPESGVFQVQCVFSDQDLPTETHILVVHSGFLGPLELTIHWAQEPGHFCLHPVWPAGSLSAQLGMNWSWGLRTHS
jgi:hypothetical protein